MSIKEIAIKIAGTVALYIALRIFMVLAQKNRQRFFQRIEKHNPKLLPKALEHFSGNNKVLYTIAFIVLMIVWWFKDLL